MKESLYSDRALVRRHGHYSSELLLLIVSNLNDTALGLAKFRDNFVKKHEFPELVLEVFDSFLF
jgi:hypothetical protein